MQKYLQLFIITVVIFLISLTGSTAQQKKNTDQGAKLKTEAIADVQSKYEVYKKTALEIRGYAEVGYQESKSAALHQKTLARR